MTQQTHRPRNRSRTPRMRSRLAGFTGLTMLIGLLGAGCTNPEIPAGHEGYIHHIPLLFGKMSYTKSLAGPSSTGVSWRAFTVNIDMRERNYPEKFELLTQDDLRVSFEVNTRIRLRPGTVKVIVEKWGSTDWYKWNVKEPLRTIVRREVMKVDAADIQLKTEDVGKNIKTALHEKYKGEPFDIQSVDIGSFEFPQEVDKAIQEKIAKQQELERQDYILQSTIKEAAISVFEALKVSRRQRIIAETLDPLYVQWSAVQVYRKLAQSSNNTVIMLPNTSEGTGVPQIMSGGERKQLTAADENELASIEQEYRQKAADSKKAAAAKSGDKKPDAAPDSPAADGAKSGVESGAGNDAESGAGKSGAGAADKPADPAADPTGSPAGNSPASQPE